jgi:hypothetical protein
MWLCHLDDPPKQVDVTRSIGTAMQEPWKTHQVLILSGGFADVATARHRPRRMFDPAA